jgi:hypothetical protein
MIEFSKEHCFGLSEAARLLPHGRGGNPVSLSSLLRWSGERVHLEAVRLGGRWVTSREALQRFAQRLTPQRPVAEPTRSAPER